MTVRIARRLCVLALSAATLGAVVPLAAHAAAGNWPDRPVKLVVPFPPGGGSDTVARIVAKSLSERIGQAVVVDNRAGGGGTVGVGSALKSPADGYTLIWCSPAAQYLAPSDVPYKPFEDLTPVSLAVEATYLLVTSPDSPYKTLPDVIAAAKKNPTAINYATAGANGHGRLMGEYMKMLGGFDMQAIPFTGEGPAMIGVIGQEVQIGFISSAASWPQVQSGKMHAIANTSAKAFPGIPESIAPVSRTLPGYDVTAINYVAVRTGTPPEIVQKASEALQAVLADPEVKAQIAKLGVIAQGSTPDALGARVKSEYEQWRDVRKQAGLPD
ncbi:tripartite tricarboxylate transporter substrate binding protein [Achromobacter sp. GG226]|uniref:Bug family tripartite tricarboxylate transporter substrate binding protein n=1 Tax=Verticiella alkaliphila TaxID=2779529 RepID=UPI001C0B7AB1|nr:tripartite tricarboxylate transporter substrate binding protein [Verticiella sp. GG226]MBU4610408.1 tripartite tricarboxylate transporter substrate binding protein [Verticiella sp. GG226]